MSIEARFAKIRASHAAPGNRRWPLLYAYALLGRAECYVREALRGAA